MKFLCAVKGCPGLDNIRNERIGEESGVQLILTRWRMKKKGGAFTKNRKALPSNSSMEMSTNRKKNPKKTKNVAE
jgi:hypothetical protein